MKEIIASVHGSIALIKAINVFRELNNCGVRTKIIMTKSAEEILPANTAKILSCCEVFTNKSHFQSSMPHLDLVKDVDLFVVAPATANALSKFACGAASDLESTSFLACDKQKIIFPSMNPRMWSSPFVKRNVDILRESGVVVRNPEIGQTICGDFGEGRFPEIEQVVKEILEHINK